MRDVIPIRFESGILYLLDQRVLPLESSWIQCRNAAEAADAIRDMVVRGAPAIAITAAYGMAMEASAGGDLSAARTCLQRSRPTAVNLRWALERLAVVPPEHLLAEARRLHEEDRQINIALGDHGARLLPENSRVYHHCNTGALATGGWGTALGVIRSANRDGRLARVFIGETRPYLQGARLTTYECLEENIPCTLVTDSMAAQVMSEGLDAVLVGCDRVARNGDTANKIGTLSLAILARHFEVPFYVCMPMSTLDRRCASGADIPIEVRPQSELYGYRETRWAPEVEAYNPSFDVTPASLITAWVTEHGVLSPPFDVPRP